MCSQWPNMGQLNIEIDHNNNTLNSIAKIRLHSAHMLSCFSCVQLFSTLRTVAHKAPLSIEFSRQEYWSGQSFPYPGDLPNPSIAPTSLTSPALAGRFFTISSTWETIAQMLLLLLSRFSRVRLCDPRDCSLPGFSIHGVLQARILEWVVIPFSRESSQDQTQVSCIAGGFFIP